MHNSLWGNCSPSLLRRGHRKTFFLRSRAALNGQFVPEYTKARVGTAELDVLSHLTTIRRQLLHLSQLTFSF